MIISSYKKPAKRLTLPKSPPDNTGGFFEVINIVLKGNPISTQHAYGQKGKIRFMKSEAIQLKNSYILQAKMQYRGPVITERLQITIRLFFPDKRVRDWDNFHKISMDSLTGIVWKDDSQVKRATIEMMDGEPRIEVRVEKL